MLGSLAQATFHDAALVAQTRAAQQQQVGLSGQTVGFGHAVAAAASRGLSRPHNYHVSKELSFKEELQKEIDDWLEDI